MSLALGIEEWRPAFGVPGYSVSSLGRVRNETTRRVRKLPPNDKGYVHLSVGSGRNRKNFSVHRVVASSFLGNDGGLEVNHLNGDKSDNRVFNLEWCTRSENVRHSHRRLCRKPVRKGDFHALTRVSDEEVAFVRSRVANGESQKDVAKAMGVSRAWVSLVVNGKRRS
jgi:hypothetical protein